MGAKAKECSIYFCSVYVGVLGKQVGIVPIKGFVDVSKQFINNEFIMEASSFYIICVTVLL